MKVWIAGLLLLTLAACSQAQKTDEKAAAGEKISYAKHFRIISHADYKELQVLNPETGKIEKRYGLVKRDKQVSLPGDLTKIEIPLKSVVALSGTHIGMLEKIGCADKISGISSKNYVFNATVLQACNAGKVAEFADMGILNPESVLKTGAKVIVYNGFEGAPPPNEEKLEKLGILCLPDYDWKEQHPLGKAEWIKLFGVLFDKEQAAEAYFTGLEKRYLSLVESAQKVNHKPTVFSGMIFGDSWYMPASESFGAQLFKDAGADYMVKDVKGTGSAVYTFEQVLKNNQHSEFWFNLELPTKKEVLTANAKYQYFDAFKNNNVYTYAHRMNDFWENSAIEPDRVLSDLIRIFHGDQITTSPLRFYRKLAE